VVLGDLPAGEMVSVLAALVKASRELARLSGAAEVQIVTGPLSDGALEQSSEAAAEPMSRASRSHLRFHLVPRFSGELGLARPAGRQAWPVPSRSIV